MSKVAKCGRCRQKKVARKRAVRAKDGSTFVACSCGKQWLAKLTTRRRRGYGLEIRR